LCTPDAAKPDSWVNREIEIFREVRKGGEIHAIIGAGKPPSCFPPSLLREHKGNLEQPLAADLRPAKRGGDGATKHLLNWPPVLQE
jgi:hypothetical protein